VQEIENGSPTVNYIRTLNIDEPLARINAIGGAVRYYHADALGSIIGLSDETGQEVTQYVYDPFGNVTISGEASDNPFQYTGRENDGTGLYYYRARYFSPELQRFISEDPIGFEGGTVNLYEYVQNTPINLTDPLGLASCIGGCHPGRIGNPYVSPSPPQPDPSVLIPEPPAPPPGSGCGCELKKFIKIWQCNTKYSIEYHRCVQGVIVSRDCYKRAEENWKRCLDDANKMCK
jgi:RHS repeat-associated protein